MIKQLLFIALVACLPVLSIAQTAQTKKMGDKVFVENTNDGVIVEDGFTINGKKEGCWTSYYKNGKPKEIHSYINDVRFGKSIFFSAEDGMSKIETYHNGKLEGPTRLYHPNGRLKALMYYRDGVLNGYKKTYYADGNLQESGRYQDGKADGEHTYYYPNPDAATYSIGQSEKILAIYNFDKGIKNGLATFYNRAGYITSMGTYANDQKNGVWKEFHLNGALSEEGEFVNGNKKGIWKSYDKKGKFIKNITY